MRRALTYTKLRIVRFRVTFSNGNAMEGEIECSLYAKAKFTASWSSYNELN